MSQILVGTTITWCLFQLYCLRHFHRVRSRIFLNQRFHCAKNTVTDECLIYDCIFLQGSSLAAKTTSIITYTWIHFIFCIWLWSLSSKFKREPFNLSMNQSLAVFDCHLILTFELNVNRIFWFYQWIPLWSRPQKNCWFVWYFVSNLIV